MDPVVKVDGVEKTFVRRHSVGGWKDLLVRGGRGRESARVHALRGVSFEVHRGGMVGIVGANGAGKSTLLRLLGGIGKPSVGTVDVRGRIGALLELGGGFQGDLSGRENAILAAVVAGLLKREALRKLPEIVRFAQLEPFIDAPVRTYSTGMTMRLAFSVAVHTEPDVLLVDEHLAVGDLAFQAKCADRIRRLREAGCAVALVSHSMEQVRDMCDQALWLRDGRIAARGPAKEVAAAYEREMREESLRRTPSSDPAVVGADGRTLRSKENRLGSLEIEITRVELRPGAEIEAGDPLHVAISYLARNAPVPDPIFSVTITAADGARCVDVNTRSMGVAVPDADGAGEVRLRIERLDLAPGCYQVDVGIFESGWRYAYDYHWHVYQLVVRGSSAQRGILAPPCRWQIEMPAKAAGLAAS